MKVGAVIMKYKLYVFLLILSLLIIVAGCNDLAISNDQGEVGGEYAGLKLRDYERYNDDGELTMKIVFTNPLGQGTEGYLTFVVSMDNHKYDLNEYDLSDYVSLVNDKGESPEGSPKWVMYSGGGHHVINYLLFPDDGFITNDTEYMKLVVRDYIDFPVREFVWEKEFLGIKE